MDSAAERSWIARTARHPVAANLIMILMMVSGLWSLNQLNTQFFPTFELDFVTVQVQWRGASAEDVADAITSPLEDELRDVDDLREMTSTSAEGQSVIVLELEEGADITQATESIKDRVARVPNLPEDAREPTVSRVVRYDPIASLVVKGDLTEQELRELSYRLEEELLDRGVTRIEFEGLADQEIEINIGQSRLNDMGLTFADLAGRIRAQSLDMPAGEAGEQDVARQLRGLDQARSADDFSRLPLTLGDAGTVLLGDVASVRQQARDNQVRIVFQGEPGVEMLLQRAEREDALAAARILEEFMSEHAGSLPDSVELMVMDEFWQFLNERIALLLENGFFGLILVIAVLFAFLSGRVAVWVALGIPTSFLAAMTVLFFTGGSINMLSLFALIMTLGIIVDNAIVVGENSLYRYQSGEDPTEAAINGARRMAVPVMAASLTTIAAFLPLMLIGGPIGNILFAIPLVVICVIIAAVIQAFLILPGHLRRAFERGHNLKPGPTRQKIDNAFNRFRDGAFRSAVERALDFRWATILASVGVLIVAVALVPSGRLNFTFFPNVEGNIVFANVDFAAGTPPERIENYLEQLEASLHATEEALDEDLVIAALVNKGRTQASDEQDARRGDRFGSIKVELVSPGDRDVRNREFIRAWEENAPQAPGLENLTIRERGTGPPGADIDVRMTGALAPELKEASLRLQDHLRQIEGVSGISDDLPQGPEQWIYRLNEQGRALGLTNNELGSQLRAAYSGELVQIYHHRRDEMEVWVRLEEASRDRLGALDDFHIRTPAGEQVLLSNVADIETRRSFESLRHFEGRLAVRVSADVDAEIANANRILASLESDFLPELSQKYGLQTAFEGQAADQEETLEDMRNGLLLALALIYLILAFVFKSYGWPILVMTVIPFGAIGAFVGHYLMGFDLSILSLFGLFGLSGIVVNNSIILVTFYRELRDRAPEQPPEEALVEASCLRLRPVLVTSLTTIGGLLPLIFEQSVQAQFLIPMAIAIAFGLAVATGIVLFLVPAMLAIYENAVRKIQRSL